MASGGRFGHAQKMDTARDTLPNMAGLDRLAQNLPNRGLCEECQHARRMESDHGSVFLLCQLSFEDANFAKYPRLPVVACGGYKPDEKSSASQ
jgi:hypothetical protein